MTLAIVCKYEKDARTIINELMATYNHGRMRYPTLNRPVCFDNGLKVIWINTVDKTRGYKFDAAVIEDYMIVDERMKDVIFETKIRTKGEVKYVPDIRSWTSKVIEWLKGVIG